MSEQRKQDKARKVLATPFGLAVVALVLLAGWSLWTAGIFDDDVQHAARSGSVYAAEGTGVDTEQAARIIGNRRLVVVFLEPGTDLGDTCDTLGDAASGTLVLLMSRTDEDWDTYGCSRLPGHDDETFGKAFVAETQIGSGTDQFVDKPLDALKVIDVNYDQLVRAGVIPDGARTISPSLSRYLIAIAAIGAVLAGSALAYAGARRAGRLAAVRQESRDTAEDAETSLNARAAVLAQHIIELDRRYQRARRQPAFRKKYRTLAAEYAALAADLDDRDREALGRRIQSLTDRCRNLAKART
jgi:hypothetical protein